jgi:cob(I)alamin adenosyltransferase
MKLYTRTGDTGETSIVGGRVSKASIKVETYGTVDEANSLIGIAIAHLPEEETTLRAELIQIQHELFDCGSDLSLKEGTETKFGYKVNKEMVSFLEERIDAYQDEAPELRCFILPGGTLSASYLHAARTVVRRAERLTVRLARREKINPWVLIYLNRLSDFLFAAARVMNHRAGYQDIYYVRSGQVFKQQNNNERNE